MPNGGPDNCGTCGFNRRNQGLWRNPTPGPLSDSFCTIRQVLVLNDHWTYCVNWHTRERVPQGPIYASGLYDNGYHRIPWHGSVEPRHCDDVRCAVCGTLAPEGIEIPMVEAAPLSFCSNAHYVQWWKTMHPDETATMSAEPDRDEEM